jgi:hypothetical protein
MIDEVTRLFSVLHASGIDLEAECLLDALWIAGRLPATSRERADIAPILPSTSIGTGHLPPSVPSASPLAARVPPRRFPVATPQTFRVSERPGMAVRLPAGDRPFRVGGLLRALKPLRKLAPSPIELEPDEEATVDLWSSRGVQSIVFRPRPEKTRSVYLVIDSGASMELWHEVTTSWRRTIVGSGLFRSVRAFLLDTDRDRPGLRPCSARRSSPYNRNRSPERRRGPLGTTPLPPGREPLVLIFTDACSRAWWNGKAFDLAAGWARQSALGLICLLPETMWHRTALSRGSFVTLYRPADGGPLYTLSLPGLGGTGEVFPVASIQARSIATLALLLG